MSSPLCSNRHVLALITWGTGFNSRVRQFKYGIFQLRNKNNIARDWIFARLEIFDLSHCGIKHLQLTLKRVHYLYLYQEFRRYGRKYTFFTHILMTDPLRNRQTEPKAICYDPCAFAMLYPKFLYIKNIVKTLDTTFRQDLNSYSPLRTSYHICM